jgi:hypothetical protein
MPARSSEAEESLDLTPDGDGQDDACDEEDDEHEPEPDPGASRPPPMRDPRLPARAMKADRVPNCFVIDDGNVVRPRLTRLPCHS